MLDFQKCNNHYWEVIPQLMEETPPQLHHNFEKEKEKENTSLN
jgi:hypothetical protein